MQLCADGRTPGTCVCRDAASAPACLAATDWRCRPCLPMQCAQEVDAFGAERELSPADLESFPYISAVVNEALRLYPPGACDG